MQLLGIKNSKTATTIGFSKWQVSCFYETFVLNSTLSIPMNFSTENSPLRKAENRYPHLKQNPYWGNHFWSREYFVTTEGIDEYIIKRYVKYEEE